MKTTHQPVRQTLLSCLTLVAGLAFAGEYPTNPERSFTSFDPPAAKSSAEVRAELDAYRANPVSSDGYQYVGGERGDALAPHKFSFADGKLETAGNVVVASSGATWTAEEMKMASRDYREAP